MKIKRTTILKWSCLLLLAGYTVWAVVWARGEASRHLCHDIRVRAEAPSPADSIVRKGVLEELSRYPGKIKGVPIDRVNTGDICRYLNGLNTFETVNCMMGASGELCVDVVPMVPVMRVFIGNSSYYINKDGKHIASNAEFFTDVPVVTGNFTRRFRPVDILPLVRFVSSDPTMRDLTAMIVAKDARNLIVVPRITGHVVNFGDTTRLAEKRDALRAFYRRVLPYKGWAEYDTISVKFRNQIVATRRDKSRLNVAEEAFEEEDLEEGTLPDVAALPGAAGTPAGPSNDQHNKANSHE